MLNIYLAGHPKPAQRTWMADHKACSAGTFHRVGANVFCPVGKCSLCVDGVSREGEQRITINKIPTSIAWLGTRTGM